MSENRWVVPSILAIIVSFLTCGCSEKIPKEYLGCYISYSAPPFILEDRRIVIKQNESFSSEYEYHIGRVSSTVYPIVGIKLLHLPNGMNKFEWPKPQGQIFLFDPDNKSRLIMVSSDNSIVDWRKVAC